MGRNGTHGTHARCIPFTLLTTTPPLLPRPLLVELIDQTTIPSLVLEEKTLSIHAFA